MVDTSLILKSSGCRSYLCLVAVLQKFGKDRQPGVNLLFAGAGAEIQIGAATWAQSFTIFRTQCLSVHSENERGAGQVAHIHLSVLQEHDLVVLLVLEFLRQHAAVRNLLLLQKFLSTAVAHSVQRGPGRHIQLQNIGGVPHLAGDGNGTADRIPAREFHIGKVQLKLELQVLAEYHKSRESGHANLQEFYHE